MSFRTQYTTSPINANFSRKNATPVRKPSSPNASRRTTSATMASNAKPRIERNTVTSDDCTSPHTKLPPGRFREKANP